MRLGQSPPSSDTARTFASQLRYGWGNRLPAQIRLGQSPPSSDTAGAIASQLRYGWGNRLPAQIRLGHSPPSSDTAGAIASQLIYSSDTHTRYVPTDPLACLNDYLIITPQLSYTVFSRKNPNSYAPSSTGENKSICGTDQHDHLTKCFNNITSTP